MKRIKVGRLGFVVAAVCLSIAASAIGQLTPPAATGSAGPATMPALARQQGPIIAITIHRSEVVTSPWPVKNVAVTSPDVADVQVLTPRQVLLQGKQVGWTDLVLHGQEGQVYQARVEVNANMEQVKDDLKRLFPDSTLTVTQSRDMVMLSGQLSRAEQAQQIDRYFKSNGIKYVDMTSVAGVQQVLLQVRVAEVSRTAIRSLGFNALFTGNDFFGGITVGSAEGGPINPINIGPPEGALAKSGLPFVFNSAVNVSPGVTLFGGVPDADFQFFLQALAENQYMRILAEPNLVALSGEEASFLAGGEYPIPVVQGSNIGGGTSITVEYKEFGVRLRFRPRVLGDNRIRLYVAPEVSQLSSIGAVQIQGFQIPSLISRKADTTLELNSGQTFAMAGLISRNAIGRSSRIPGLGDIPVLGALFRSVRYQNDETELLVLVTASLAEPLNQKPPTPGVLHVPPNDWELYGLAKIEGKLPCKLGPVQRRWLEQAGLKGLRGPGAWAGYAQPGAHLGGGRPLPATVAPRDGGPAK